MMTARHRERVKRSTLGAWVLRYKVDLTIVAVGVGCWSWAVYGYTH